MGIGLGSSRQQVSRLKSIASECDSIKNKFKTICNNMDTYFTGEAATACKAALERRVNDFNKMKIEALNIAQTLSSAIEEIEEEEREERRGSGGGGSSGGGSQGGPGMYL